MIYAQRNITLSQYARQWFYWPFWGLQGNTPLISAGGNTWVAMELQNDYVPEQAVLPGAQWYRALIAGPKSTNNPIGTLVVQAPRNNLLFKVETEEEVEIPADDYQVIEVV